MASLADPIRKVQRIIAAAGKKPQTDNTKPQNAAALAMIVDVRNIFHKFAAFGDGRIINDKISVRLGGLIKLKLVADFSNDLI